MKGKNVVTSVCGAVAASVFVAGYITPVSSKEEAESLEISILGLLTAGAAAQLTEEKPSEKKENK